MRKLPPASVSFFWIFLFFLMLTISFSGGLKLRAYSENADGSSPNQAPQAQRVPFPEVKDWNSVVITLDRSGCFGRCPAYHVEIHGDGTVIYFGKTNVLEKGERRGRVTLEGIKALVEKFRQA